MSAEMITDTNPTIIYIPLLNEGTTVYRPVPSIPLGTDTFRVGRLPEGVADDEEWEFPPGSIVRCEPTQSQGEDVLVAREQIQLSHIVSL